MRDRWVLLFVVACLAQIPLYLALGKAPVTYDYAIKSAEKALLNPPTPEQIKAIRDDLETCERALQAIPGGTSDSRQARLDMAAALLSWHEGNTAAADAFFRKSLEGFESTHGPDSFHTSVVSLRYAEFLMMVRRYDEALTRFALGVGAIEDTLGPGNPLATRMIFRHVALLSYMGRHDEAVKRAEGHLDSLLDGAGKFDEMFLTQTGGVLDLLNRGYGLRNAPGASWQRALKAAYDRGQASADEDEAQ